MKMAELEIGDTVKGYDACSMKLGQPGGEYTGKLERLNCESGRKAYGFACHMVGGMYVAAATCTLVAKAVKPVKLPEPGEWIRITGVGTACDPYGLVGGEPVLMKSAEEWEFRAYDCTMRVEARSPKLGRFAYAISGYEPAESPFPKAGEWVEVTKVPAGATAAQALLGCTVQLTEDMHFSSGPFHPDAVVVNRLMVSADGYKVVPRPVAAAVPARDSWVKVASLWKSPREGDRSRFEVGQVLKVHAACQSNKGPQWAYAVTPSGYSAVGTFVAMPALPKPGSWIKITSWGDCGECPSLEGKALKVIDAAYEIDGSIHLEFEGEDGDTDDCYCTEWEATTAPNPVGKWLTFESCELRVAAPKPAVAPSAMPKEGDLVRVLEIDANKLAAASYAANWRGARVGSEFYVYMAFADPWGGWPVLYRDGFSGGNSGCMRVEVVKPATAAATVAAPKATEREPNRYLPAGTRVRILETRPDITGAVHTVGEEVTITAGAYPKTGPIEFRKPLPGVWHYVHETNKGGSTARVEVIS
jgi:hypothetical protein